MEALPVIKAKGLKKSYVCPTEVVCPIDGLDLEVNEGDFVLIYGPSGSGKTTLLNLLAGLDKLDGGTLWFKGERYDEKSDRQLTWMRRDHIGVIFQSFELISVMSCFENIEYPLIMQGVAAPERKRRVREIAALLDIESILARRPEKISGGQRQRVAICRALVGNYSLILGDEVTGNLDPRMSERVYAVLSGMNNGKKRTFIMVTHNVDLKKYATKVYHLANGVLQEEQR
jgi:putative ABC transport system ATP-binding protein